MLCGNFLPKKDEKRKQRIEEKLRKYHRFRAVLLSLEFGCAGWRLTGNLGEVNQLEVQRPDAPSQPLRSSLRGVTYPRTTALSVSAPCLSLSCWPDAGQVFQGHCSWFPCPQTSPFCMTRPVLLKPSCWSHKVSWVILTLTNTSRHLWETVGFLKILQSLKMQGKPASLLENPKESASVCLFVFLGHFEKGEQWGRSIWC